LRQENEFLEVFMGLKGRRETEEFKKMRELKREFAYKGEANPLRIESVEEW